MARPPYDPRTIAKLVDPETGRVQALQDVFAVKSGVDPLQATEALKNYEDSSAVTHLTRDDPPVLLEYAANNTRMAPGKGIHHPRFGYFLKERMDKLGIECVVNVKKDYEDKPAGQREADIVEFLARHFPH